MGELELAINSFKEALRLEKDTKYVTLLKEYSFIYVFIYLLPICSIDYYGTHAITYVYTYVYDLSYIYYLLSFFMADDTIIYTYYYT